MQTRKTAAERLAEAQAITSEARAAADLATGNFAAAAGELAAVNEAISAADATDDAVLSELARRKAILETKREALRKPLETAKAVLLEAQGVQGPLAAAAHKEALEAEFKAAVVEVRECEVELIAECEKFLARFQQERKRLADLLLDANHIEADLVEIRTGVRAGEGNAGFKVMGTLLGQVPAQMDDAEAMQHLVRLSRVRTEEQIRRGEEERHPKAPRDPTGSGVLPPPRVTHDTITTAELEHAEIARRAGLES